MADNFKIPKNFPNVCTQTVFSFISRIETLKIVAQSKSFRQILSISPNEYKLIKLIYAIVPSKSLNILRYYDYFCNEFPEISPSIIKEYLFFYLKILTQNNTNITINSSHPLAEEFIRNHAVNQCIRLQVDSKHFMNDGFSIEGVKTVYQVSVTNNALIIDNQDINGFFIQVVPKNIKRLRFYSFQEYNEEKQALFLEHLCNLKELEKFKTTALTDLVQSLIKKCNTLKHVEFNSGPEVKQIGDTINQVVLKNKNIENLDFLLNEGEYKVSNVLSLVDNDTKKRLKKLLLMELEYDKEIDFSEYTNLEKFHMRFCNFSKEIRDLHCTKLKYVNLSHLTYSYDFLINIVKSNLNLEFLTFSIDDILDCDEDKPKYNKLFTEINKLQKLKSISIICKNFSEIELKSVSVESFSLETQQAFDVSKLISNCPNINEIYSNYYTDDSYNEVEEIVEFNFPSTSTTLKRITLLNFLLPLPILNTFYNYPNLEYLHMCGRMSEQTPFVTKPNISQIPNIKNLDLSITIESTDLNREFWMDIADNLSKLTKLENFRVPKLPDEFELEFNRKVCDALPKLFFLQNIAYDLNPINQQQVKVLNQNYSKFKNVDTFDVVLMADGNHQNFEDEENPEGHQDIEEDVPNEEEKTFRTKFRKFFEGLIY